METLLDIFQREMELLGIDYSYMTNSKPKITYPYVTGEYSESEFAFENGASGGDLMLEAWNRGNNLDLIRLNEKIKKHFCDFRKIEGNIAIRIVYNGNFPRRTNDNGLKKSEIHLDVMYWEGE